jgi:YVTN family beta-propeller protein
MRPRPPGSRRLALARHAAALICAVLPGLAGSAPLAWISNNGSSNLSVIDTASDSVSGAPVFLSPQPTGVAVGASKVYVVHDSGQFAVIDKATRNVTTPLNLGGGLLGVALSPDGTRAYVGNESTNAVFVINTATNAQITSFSLQQPRGIAVSPDGSRVYVACDDMFAPRLAIINATNNTVLPNQVALPPGPYGVAVSPNGQRVYVSNEVANSVSVVDAVSNVKLTDVFLAGVNPRGIVVDRSGTRAYVAMYGSGQVATIDTSTNTSLGSVFAGGNSPIGIDVNADGSRVYVANNGSGTVGVINTATSALIGTVFVGQQPFALGRFIEEPPPPAPVPPVMNDVPDQNGMVGAPFSLALAGYVVQTNGDPILSYAIASGTLPAGLNLNTSSGVISGTPQLAGTGYTISVTATDKDGASNADTIRFSIAMPGSVPARDILVGSFNTSVRGFGPGANGNAAPSRVIAGTTAQVQYPLSMSYEPKEDVMYVGDFYGQAVRVFPVGANGDATPRRVLDSVYVGQVHVLAVDTQHDELVLATSGCILCTWSRTASGSDGPLRRVSWGGNSSTQLNNPFGLALDPAHDLMFVGDSDFGSSATPYAGKVLVFPRTAAGDVAPARVIKGPTTRLGPNASYLAFDATMQLLYVLTSSVDAADSSLRHARILVFSAAADGDAAPLRAIEGPATQLDIPSTQYPYGLSFDAPTQRLLVSIYSNTNAGNRVLAFFAGDSGNVAPLLSLGGANTGFDKIGTAVAVPDRILRNGFDIAP